MIRILFIDDDPLTLTILNKSARVFGHEAILSLTGEEGFRLAVEQSPDIIFVDMRLSGADGLELVRRLRMNQATAMIPLIVLSASQELDAEEKALSSGADAFLRKPVQLQKLSDVIQQYTTPVEPHQE